MVVSSTVPFER